MLLPHSRIFPVNTFQVCFLFRDQSPSEHFLCRCTLQQRTDQSVESRYTQPRPPTNGLTCGENNRLNTDRKWMESPFRNEWWNEMNDVQKGRNKWRKKESWYIHIKLCFTQKIRTTQATYALPLKLLTDNMSRCTFDILPLTYLSSCSKENRDLKAKQSRTATATSAKQ